MRRAFPCCSRQHPSVLENAYAPRRIWPRRTPWVSGERPSPELRPAQGTSPAGRAKAPSLPGRPPKRRAARESRDDRGSSPSDRVKKSRSTLKYLPRGEKLASRKERAAKSSATRRVRLAAFLAAGVTHSGDSCPWEENSPVRMMFARPDGDTFRRHHRTLKLPRPQNEPHHLSGHRVRHCGHRRCPCHRRTFSTVDGSRGRTRSGPRARSAHGLERHVGR